MPKKRLFMTFIKIYLYKGSNKHIPKRHFQEKNIFENSDCFSAPCLKPADLKVPLKLTEKNMSYYFSHILVMKSSHLCIL